jgi:hypothetical protein
MERWIEACRRTPPVALVRAGAEFNNGKRIERPDESEGLRDALGTG